MKIRIRIWERLKSPVGLAVQGFVLGGLLFMGMNSALDRAEPVPESGAMEIVVLA